MVWLLTGKDRDAIDATVRALERAGVAEPRVSAEDRHALAEELLGALAAEGWCVSRALVQPDPTVVGMELVVVLENAIEACLDWETFKGSSDHDIAHSLYQHALREGDVKLVGIARDGNDEVL